MRVEEFFTDLQREGEGDPQRDLNNYFVDLAVNLGHLRRDRGLSQVALAKKAGTSQPRIAEIEGAQGNPTFNTLSKLAHALEVPLSLLVATAQVAQGEVLVVTYDTAYPDEPSAQDPYHQVIRDVALVAANDNLAVAA